MRPRFHRFFAISLFLLACFVSIDKAQAARPLLSEDTPPIGKNTAEVEGYIDAIWNEAASDHRNHGLFLGYGLTENLDVAIQGAVTSSWDTAASAYVKWRFFDSTRGLFPDVSVNITSAFDEFNLMALSIAGWHVGESLLHLNLGYHRVLGNSFYPWAWMIEFPLFGSFGAGAEIRGVSLDRSEVRLGLGLRYGLTSAIVLDLGATLPLLNSDLLFQVTGGFTLSF